jgi:transcriptional regulator with XRE-family HTH domain
MVEQTELRNLIRARRQLPPPPTRRALREASGLSGADVARAMGVTRQAVSNWERGLRDPRGATLDAYLEVLALLREEGP